MSKIGKSMEKAWKCSNLQTEKSIIKRVMDRHIDQRLLNISCKGPDSKSVNILGFEGHTIPVTTTQRSLLPL